MKSTQMLKTQYLLIILFMLAGCLTEKPPKKVSEKSIINRLEMISVDWAPNLDAFVRAGNNFERTIIVYRQGEENKGNLCFRVAVSDGKVLNDWENNWKGKKPKRKSVMKILKIMHENDLYSISSDSCDNINFQLMQDPTIDYHIVRDSRCLQIKLNKPYYKNCHKLK